MPKSSCLIGLLWSGQSFGESTISDFESPVYFQVKEKKLLKSVKKQRNYALNNKNAKIVMLIITTIKQLSIHYIV